MKQILLLASVAASLFMACEATNKSATLAVSPLEETYWRLTELMGKPVPVESTIMKPSFIMLNKASTLVSASGGCNAIGGAYALEEGNRIKFSQMISTQMACPDMATEQQLLKALETADSYIISGNKLSLNRARMAPLAIFEAALKPK